MQHEKSLKGPLSPRMISRFQLLVDSIDFIDLHDLMPLVALEVKYLLQPSFSKRKLYFESLQTSRSSILGLAIS